MRTSSLFRLLVVALLPATIALLPGAAGAVTDAAKAEQQQQQRQPLNNAPVWREARSEQAGFVTIKTPEAGVLIQSEGMTWRALRNGPVTLYGGILLLVVPTAIGLYYLRRGTLRLREPPTGRMAQRFSPFERFVHWGTAISFVVLALSGLGMLFGKHVLTPWMGHWLASLLLLVGKNLHNFVGPVFLGFLLLMIVAFLRDNVWEACDALWIRKAGGLIHGEHVPSGRFNFGEKTWFWIGVTFLGLTVAGTGLVLDFPNFGQTRGLLQTINLIHDIAATLLILLSLGHIYMGTLGVEGALESMKTGSVDEAWAKEHHEYWYNDIKAGKSGHPGSA
jgi:formate dehydrogenase subunit gamma